MKLQRRSFLGIAAAFLLPGGRRLSKKDRAPGFSDVAREGVILKIPGPTPWRHTIYCFVRNMSGKRLKPGLLVGWQFGYRGRRVVLAGTRGSKGTSIAGAVTRYRNGHFPPSGIPHGALFWIMVEGRISIQISPKEKP